MENKKKKKGPLERETKKFGKRVILKKACGF